MPAAPALGPRLPPKAMLPSQVQPAPSFPSENRRSVAAKHIVGDRHVFCHEGPAAASQSVVECEHHSPGIDQGIVGDNGILDLVVFRSTRNWEHRRKWKSRHRRDRQHWQCSC